MMHGQHMHATMLGPSSGALVDKRSTVHSAFIHLVVYLIGLGVVGIFYLNYFVLESYFLALFWATVASIPLFQVKNWLCELILNYFIGEEDFALGYFGGDDGDAADGDSTSLLAEEEADDLDPTRTLSSSSFGEDLQLRGHVFTSESGASSKPYRRGVIASSSTSSLASGSDEDDDEYPHHADQTLRSTADSRRRECTLSKSGGIGGPSNYVRKYWFFSHTFGLDEVRWYSRYESMGAVFVRDIPIILDVVYRLAYWIALQPIANFFSSSAEQESGSSGGGPKNAGGGGFGADDKIMSNLNTSTRTSRDEDDGAGASWPWFALLYRAVVVRACYLTYKLDPEFFDPLGATASVVYFFLISAYGLLILIRLVHGIVHFSTGGQQPSSRASRAPSFSSSKNGEDKDADGDQLPIRASHAPEQVTFAKAFGRYLRGRQESGSVGPGRGSTTPTTTVWGRTRTSARISRRTHILQEKESPRTNSRERGFSHTSSLVVSQTETTTGDNYKSSTPGQRRGAEQDRGDAGIRNHLMRQEQDPRLTYSSRVTSKEAPSSQDAQGSMTDESTPPRTDEKREPLAETIPGDEDDARSKAQHESKGDIKSDARASSSPTTVGGGDQRVLDDKSDSLIDSNDHAARLSLFQQLFVYITEAIREAYYFTLATILTDQIHTILAIVIIVGAAVLGSVFMVLCVSELAREAVFVWTEAQVYAENHELFQQRVMPMLIGLGQAMHALKIGGGTATSSSSPTSVASGVGVAPTAGGVSVLGSLGSTSSVGTTSSTLVSTSEDASSSSAGSGGASDASSPFSTAATSQNLYTSGSSSSPATSAPSPFSPTSPISSNPLSFTGSSPNNSTLTTSSPHQVLSHEQRNLTQYYSEYFQGWLERNLAEYEFIKLMYDVYTTQEPQTVSANVGGGSIMMSAPLVDGAAIQAQHQ
ncbi:unnamed protein product [Amoebophrya sp. A25]|nr:unnamed protein product [Amoebophrya sp. A25]|eukprot:GSA25T00017767001.1